MYGGNGVVMPVHHYRMFRLSGRSFSALDGGPGRATREVFTLVWGALTSGRTYLNVLITELYGIAGVVYMSLDVTFSCVNMWIDVCVAFEVFCMCLVYNRTGLYLSVLCYLSELVVLE